MNESVRSHFFGVTEVRYEQFMKDMQEELWSKLGLPGDLVVDFGPESVSGGQNPAPMQDE